ncbi:hypothetical protein IKT18_03190 [Candidatus Saccharibacteria bacterium]|nr:hypothetical protein [Candidatus Saccharibacteria bacterium]
METTVKRVFVAVMDNGKSRVLPCPIRTADGKLMTQRLKRLINGNYQWNYAVWCDDCDDAHIFVNHDVYSQGLVWKRPLTLLTEIAQDRIELQHELYMLEGSSELTRAAPVLVPADATNSEISNIVLHELELRQAIKSRLRELSDIKKSQSDSHEYSGGGWMQP